MAAGKRYLVCLLLLITVGAVLAAGCTSSPEEAQNNTTRSTFPTPIPATDVITTNPPGITYIRPAFTMGNVITENLSNPCVGLVVLKPSPPQEAYVLREANRCTPNGPAWAWTGEPFSRPYAEIDNGEYVAIEHIDNINAVIGLARTIP